MLFILLIWFNVVYLVNLVNVGYLVNLVNLVCFVNLVNFVYLVNLVNLVREALTLAKLWFVGATRCPGTGSRV